MIVILHHTQQTKPDGIPIVVLVHRTHVVGREGAHLVHAVIHGVALHVKVVLLELLLLPLESVVHPSVIHPIMIVDLTNEVVNLILLLVVPQLIQPLHVGKLLIYI